MNPAVVCIGAITLDLIAAVGQSPGEDGRVIASDAAIGSGGPAATAAVALTRLGVPTVFVGTVGDDRAGRLALEMLEDEGLDPSFVRVVHGLTAMSPIIVHTVSAHRSIAAFYGTIGMPDISDAVASLCGSAEWIHVDHLGYPSLARLRSAGVRTPVSIDAGNPTPGLDLRGVALYAPTEVRLFERYGGTDLAAAMGASLDEGCEAVAVTRGAAGSIAMTAGASWGSQPRTLVEVETVRVEVTSTLGAGDVFHGAILAARVRGHDIRSSLEYANAAASLSCRGLDGRSAIPSWDEVDAVVAASHGGGAGSWGELT